MPDAREYEEEIVKLRSRIAAVEKERDAWRAATGLASLTPEQAGERIDAMDDRLADAEGVISHLCEHTSHDDYCGVFRGIGNDPPRECTCGLDAALARVAAWREGTSTNYSAFPNGSGVSLIAAERKRQVEVEGYNPEHDDEHLYGDLADAAACYAIVGAATSHGATARDFPISLIHQGDALTWPWDDDDWKPSDDPIRNLVKAGALIAAEIDRLQRAKEAPRAD